MAKEAKTKLELIDEQIQTLEERRAQVLQVEKQRIERLTKRITFLVGDVVLKRILPSGRTEFSLDECLSALRPRDREKFDEWMTQIRGKNENGKGKKNDAGS